MKKIILSMFLLGTLLNASAQLPSYLPSNGLVGWWGFNGNANDESGNGNNGLVIGPKLTIDRFGRSGKAYFFKDTDRIKVNPINILPSTAIKGQMPISISFWAITKKQNSTLSVISWISDSSLSKFHPQYGHSFDLTINSEQACGYKSGLSFYSGSHVGTATFSNTADSNWHQYTMVFGTNSIYRHDNIKFYVDGKLISTMGCAHNWGGWQYYIPRMNLFFGKNFFNGIYGALDDIGIWNRELTQNEIAKLYISCTKSITQQPTNQGMFNGNAIFTCATNDTLVNYQWQSDLGMGWTNLNNAGQYSGTTTNSLQISNVTSTNNNQKFRCILKGDCLTDTTNEAALKVWGLGIEDEIVDELIVYPTPSSTQVIIDNGNYSTMGSYTAKIVNASGQQVFQSVINQQQFVIDAKTMGGAGVYTLYITDANNKVVGVKKIVLQ